MHLDASLLVLGESFVKNFVVRLREHCCKDWLYEKHQWHTNERNLKKHQLKILLVFSVVNKRVSARRNNTPA